MPKQRTHSGAKKRFRVTRTGKVLHARQNLNHLFEHKPSTRTRRLQGTTALSGGDVGKVRRMLGGR
jgi:large subunit ribosomal protein L35